MLCAHNLVVEASGRRILGGVGAELRPGLLTAVVGPNGAGKSTLLRCLTGALKPNLGTVELDDLPLWHWPPRELARRRAVLCQDSVQTPYMDAEELVELGRSPYSYRERKGESERIIALAMDAAGALGLVGRKLATLSGGERQRVQFARALAQVWTEGHSAPRYLLLDEPTSSLDLAHQQGLLTSVRRFVEAGNGALVVLHDLNLASLFADVILLLKGGRPAGSGTPDAVLNAQRIERVYGLPVEVIRHPTLGRPLIVPLVRKSSPLQVPAASTPMGETRLV